MSDTDRIRPRLGRWDFAARERELLASAENDLPTWRLANQARRLLAETCAQLSERFSKTGAVQVAELSAACANRIAVVSLGAVGVRSSSSALMLIGTGYEREALGVARTVFEAQIRAQQVNADKSGQTARAILQGRQPGGLKSVSHRFGGKEQIALLDRLAHADVPTLVPLMVARPDRGEGESDIELRPRRGVIRPATQLFNLAQLDVGLSVLAVEAFGAGLEVPRWIDEQLQHYHRNPLPDPL